MNLLSDPWVPVRGQIGTGAFRLLTLEELLCQEGDWWVSLPRDDLELAAVQLLVSMAQVMFMPESDDALLERVSRPLAPEEFADGTGPYLDWFDLDHPTQPFMQTRGVQATEVTPIQKLLIGLPEGNNHAFFNEVGEVKRIGGAVAAIALFNQAADFATEMFVTINSTATRINKSHLVDLYEKVTWEVPGKKLASRVANLLYSEADSPLRYRINRLGGRSQQEKWILQAELYNELHRWIAPVRESRGRVRFSEYEAAAYYGLVRDFLKAASRVWGEAWGSKKHRVTEPVTIKAMIRVCAQLACQDELPAENRQARWEERLAPWSEKLSDFRTEGFYERFPAKGQVERVARIHRELSRSIGLEAPAPGGARGGLKAKGATV